VFERLGDYWGRAIRYGGEPAQPDAPAIPGEPGPTRGSVVAAMHAISDVIDQFEISERQQALAGSPELAVEKAGLLLLRGALQILEQPVGAGRRTSHGQALSARVRAAQGEAPEHGRVRRPERGAGCAVAAERVHRGNPDIEVVVLSAKSEEVLRHTHARYFYSTGQLMENLLRLVEEKLETRPAT
jgi:hypothetical protein